MGTISKKLSDIDFFNFADRAVKGDKAAGAQVVAAIQAFLLEPQKELKKQKIQAVAVSTDFAQLTKDAYNIILGADTFDLGYERAFKLVTLGPGQDSWEIYNVTNGITFKKIPEGARVDVEGFSGTKVTAYVEYYAAALGWTDKMFRYRKVPAMIDMAELFRNKYYIGKANVHYTLLAVAAAIAAHITAWGGVEADGQLQRDIQTINDAAGALTTRIKDKGYVADAANARLVMYAHPLDRARVGAAFRATTATTAPAGQTGVQVDWAIDVIFTYNAAVTRGLPILVLPNGKIQRADDLPLTMFSNPQDALTLNRDQAGWAIYGAVVADTEQCQTITLGS